MLDCLSVCGIHVIALSIFLQTIDDVGMTNVGGKFLFRSFMCLIDFLVIYPTYGHGTKNNHAWFKLNFDAYFDHNILIYIL